jgi:peptide/nickel transport system substrate-binding protein
VGVQEAGGENFSYLGFNLEDPVTGLLPVRRAIAHAIDRESILRFLFRGGGRPAQGMFPPEHWAGTDTLEVIPHDPGRARALLASAGFGADRPLHLVYKTSSDPFRVRLATVIQDQLAQVGIRLDVRSYDWGTFYGDIKAGRFQLYGLSWVGIRTPDIFRHVFHSASVPPEGANRGRYRSTGADRLIEAARAEQDLDRQAALYGELQALLLEELPYVPLWYEDQVYVSRTRVTGYRLAPDGNYDGLVDVDTDELRLPGAR